MTSSLTALSILAFVSAAVTIQAERTDNRTLVYAAKPLTTLTILALAAAAWTVVSPQYQLLIVIGLALSIAGDVFLMLPGDRFVPGLIAFLLAHVAYVLAFATRIDTWSPLAFLPFVVAMAFILRLFWPTLGRMKGPVIVYCIVIAAMAGTALSAAVATERPGAWLAAAGAVLFVISDAALGMDRFVGKLQGGRVVVLATYYPAQWMIALSVAMA